MRLALPLLLVAGLARAEPPVRTAVAAPARFVLGDDVFDATLTARGWLGLRFVQTKVSPITMVLVGDRPRRDLGVASNGNPHVVPGSRKVYVRFEREADRPPGTELMNVLEGTRVKALHFVRPFDWVFEEARRAVAVGNDGERSDPYARWHVLELGPKVSRVLAEAAEPEAAVGAVRLGGELILAVRLPDASAGASVDAKVSAVQALLRGDGQELAELAGPMRGVLVHIGADGVPDAREALPGQRPVGLAATDDGWLVVLLEGTPAHGYRDAAVLARASGEAGPFTVLAHGLEMPGQIQQLGTWVCFDEMKGETRLAHCLDPGRGLHVASQPLDGNVNLFGIDPGRPPRLFLRHLRYGEGVVDETLAMPLP